MKKTKLDWYDFRDTEVLYLKNKLIKILINLGINKANSLSKLCKDLNSTYFYTMLRNNRGITVKNLKKLLQYINKDYDFVNNKIHEIRKGNKFSIKNPKFPINLLNEAMGSLIGHLVSDGCLYYDKSRSNLIRTKFYIESKKDMKTLVKILKEIFGDIHFNQEFSRNCYTIKIGTGIVGDTFRMAGVKVGRKCTLNQNIPWIIKLGDKKMKRNYLSAIFDDEGSIGTSPPFIILSRNIHIDLTNKEKILIKNHVVPLMKENLFPTGHITRKITIRKISKVLEHLKANDLVQKILNSKPKLLQDESDLLKDECDIRNYIYVMSFQLTSNKKCSIQSSLVIRNKDDIVKFYKRIGFSLSRKQNKLRKELVAENWI